jgi:hypothetical protein
MLDNQGEHLWIGDYLNEMRQSKLDLGFAAFHLGIGKIYWLELGQNGIIL